MFRTQLTNMLLKAPAGATKISLGAMSEVDPKEYAISDRAVLCDSRGQHAIFAADATYISTVTGKRSTNSLRHQRFKRSATLLGACSRVIP